jgi:hypothetical protein
MGIHGDDLAEMEQLMLNHDLFLVHQGQPAASSGVFFFGLAPI